MQKTIELTADGVIAKLTLRTATISDDIYRAALTIRALELDSLPNLSEYAVAVFLYPLCLACTVTGEIDGKPAIDLHPIEFVKLPHKIGGAWIRAALELNPDWNPLQSAEKWKIEA
jgi:hypothetical protein